MWAGFLAPEEKSLQRGICDSRQEEVSLDSAAFWYSYNDKNPNPSTLFEHEQDILVCPIAASSFLKVIDAGAAHP